MGLFVLLAFWGVAIKLWCMDGAKIPLVFILLWAASFLLCPFFNLSAHVFLAIEAVLAALLLIIERYKSKAGNSVL